MISSTSRSREDTSIYYDEPSHLHGNIHIQNQHHDHENHHGNHNL